MKTAEIYLESVTREESNLEQESDLRLDVVDDYPGLLALEGGWNDFVEKMGNASPFVSHAWVASWWHHFGDGMNLYIVVAWRGNQIVGIAPLMSSRERRYGIPLRRIGCLYNSQVQRLDFLVMDADRREFFQQLWRQLQKLRWDILELCQFSGSSEALLEIEMIASRQGVSFNHWMQGDSPFLSIEGSWTDYLSTLSSSRRYDTRRKLRRLSEKGTVNLETISSLKEIDAALDDGFRIEAMAWKGESGTAIQSDSQLRSFYSELAKRMAATGDLRLYFLCAAGQRIAFQFCLHGKSRIYLLKPGYNPSYSRYSPSQLLTWLVLQQAFESGMTEYDFLGDSDEWKLQWTSTSRPHCWFYLSSGTFRGRFFNKLKFGLVPRIKAMMRKV